MQVIGSTSAKKDFFFSIIAQSVENARETSTLMRQSLYVEDLFKVSSINAPKNLTVEEGSRKLSFGRIARFSFTYFLDVCLPPNNLFLNNLRQFIFAKLITNMLNFSFTFFSSPSRFLGG